MEERIMPIVTIGETEYYKECDLLKRWEAPEALDPNKHEVLVVERFTYRRELQGHSLWLGYCHNSIPTYLRTQETQKDRHSHFIYPLFIGCDALSKGRTQYENDHPKVAWGLTAYLLAHESKMVADKFIFKDDSGTWCLADSLCNSYVEEQKKLFIAIQAEEYKIAVDLKDTQMQQTLESQFLTEFKASETNSLERTQNSIDKIAEPYRIPLLKEVMGMVKEFVEQLSASQKTPSDSIHKKKHTSIEAKQTLLAMFYNNSVTMQKYLDYCKGQTIKAIVSEYRRYVKAGEANNERGLIKALHSVLITLGLIPKGTSYNTFKQY